MFLRKASLGMTSFIIYKVRSNVYENICTSSCKPLLINSGYSAR